MSVDKIVDKTAKMGLSRRHFIVKVPSVVGLATFALPACSGGGSDSPEPASEAASSAVSDATTGGSPAPAPAPVAASPAPAPATAPRAGSSKSGFVPEGYRLTFADEFDDNNVSRINEDAVGGRPGAPAWRSRYRQDRNTIINGEKQVYVDPAYRGSSANPLGLQPFSIASGVLTIAATPLNERVAHSSASSASHRAASRAS